MKPNNCKTSSVCLYGTGLFLLVAMLGCGNIASSTDDDMPIALTTGKIVDPYIVGAVMFEDQNGNNIKDVGEQVSSISTDKGGFTFQTPLTIGSVIMIDTANCQPRHNGVAFTGQVKSKVESATSNMITTPLTTLLANGWTEDQIISTLQTAGLTGLSITDLRMDPLVDIAAKTAGNITKSDLTKIKATMIMRAFLAIIEGIDHNGFNLTYPIFNADPSRATMLARIVATINHALDPTIFASIHTHIANINLTLSGTLPDVTAYDVICGAVSVTDCMIQRVLSSAPYYTYEPTQLETMTWCNTIGPRFYLINHKDNASISTGMSMGLLNSLMGGISSTIFRQYTTFVINPDTGAIEGK